VGQAQQWDKHNSGAHALYKAFKVEAHVLLNFCLMVYLYMQTE
jgi:hypothetical protein